MQTPFYVNGRVLTETGQPVPEPVAVSLSCGLSSLQVIRTDLKGYFQFVLGSGPQGNMNYSAADDTPVAAGLSGTSGANTFGGFSNFGGGMTGCEVRVTLGGYQPLTTIISEPPDLGRVDVGTLHLRRIAGARGSAISVTSLMVPANARKEFEKGSDDARNDKFKPAAEHLEKAVAQYDKYAAAWNELGDVFASSHEPQKAQAAFEKAVSSDPNYIPPHVSLAVLSIDSERYQDALDSVGKALELDPNNGFALFLQALANVKLNHVDAALKSAKDAEQLPHQTVPQLHALLADIYLSRQDSASAAPEMRAYLKESPKGPLAAEIKQKLQQIDPSAGTQSKNTAQQPVAP